MWQGLGITYNWDGVGYNPAVDLPFIKAAGFTIIRMHQEQSDFTAGVTLWRTITQLALSTGFNRVIWGLSRNPGAMTASNIAAYNSAVQAEAAWAQSQNNPHLVFCIGNEEMFHHDGSLTHQQVRDNMRTLYVACKAIYTVGSITYSMANGEMFPYFQDIQANKQFPGDFASANLYSYPSDQTSGTSFTVNVGSMMAWFNNVNDTVKTLGPAVITEFSADSQGYSDSLWGDKSLFEGVFNQNLMRIIEQGVSQAYIYNFMEGSNVFGCKNTTGEFNPWWYSLRGVRKPVSVGRI